MIYDYRAQEQVRKLTLKLKNAIMIYWLKVKEARKKPSFEDIINLQKKKREEQNNVGAAKEARKRQRKEKREKLKQEALERQQEAEAHLTSYINKD